MRVGCSSKLEELKENWCSVFSDRFVSRLAAFTACFVTERDIYVPEVKLAENVYLEMLTCVYAHTYVYIPVQIKLMNLAQSEDVHKAVLPQFQVS